MDKRRWLSSIIVISLVLSVLVTALGLSRWAGWLDWTLAAGVLGPSAADKSSGGQGGERESVVSSKHAKVGTAESLSSATVGRIHFRVLDVASAGIHFHQVSGDSKDKNYPAANGSGVAMFDFDGDGIMDLYFVTSTNFPLESTRREPHNELYRNRADGSFEDVTLLSGTGNAGFGQGVTAADFDNDGFQDLYLPCYGRNVFYQNNGDGTFSDYGATNGTDDERWGTSCAALDYDGDGNLDFYVANYGQWTPEKNPFCGDDKRGIRIFCNPVSVTPETHALYRNLGNGAFHDELPSLGLDRRDGRGQGVVAADLNGDGLTDLYVANDISPNFLFLNRGGGRLEDASDLSGASRSIDGVERAGMGVDAEDVNGDGRPDLFVTNFFGEPCSMFRNDGNGFFTEISTVAGFQASGIQMVKWGTRLVDLDHDGWPDIFVVCGHVDDNLAQRGNPNAPHEEPALLWRNKGKGRFEQVSDSAGAYFASPHVGRGVAFGDLNNDGDMDVVVNHVDNVPAVLLNDSTASAVARGETPNRWIRLVVRGRSSNRDAIGMQVIVRAGGMVIHRQMKGGSSYGSAHDPRLLIGVGQAETAEQVDIQWPSGRMTRLKDVATGQDQLVFEP